MITVEEYAHTERQIELCFMAAERADDAVSYTHLTLPTPP